MGFIKKLITLTTPAIMIACGGGSFLPTVPEVEIEKYSGTWYEIAHLPQSFQKNCKCTKAVYTVEDDYIEVENECYNTVKEKFEEVEGKAFPVKGNHNSRLKVQFFWPFRGDYYIIALEDDYSYAMVGAPDRESLWILSRNKEPVAGIIKKYLNKAEELGFDTSQLVYTKHDCDQY